MPPTVPINHYDGPRNQQNRTKRPILLFHANIFEQYACIEHSNFFKVKVLVRQEPQGLKVSQKERPRWKSSTRKNRTGQPGPKFNYELFNCNLSGIEPLFPVTRWNHGRPLSYHRKLIGQKFEWTIASTRPCDSKSYYESSKSPKTLIFYLINTSLPKGRDFKHVLALELPLLYHVVKELSNKR